MKFKAFITYLAALLIVQTSSIKILAQEMNKENASDSLHDRMKKLEKVAGTVISNSDANQFIKLNSKVSYNMLDPTTNVNRKQIYLLQQKNNGNLKNGVVLGGAITAIADYWNSNRDGKFGYLMRHPTSNNQSGTNVSEVVLHSSQLSFLANMGEWVSAYGEILYDPEQSFGKGTITDLNRNQLQLRKGYVLVGNLEKFPIYASLGKMTTPFALSDTVNPFTASSSWHAFGGLAYGALIGFSGDNLNISAELVQGGAQFRSHHTPVNGTNIPSQANNYVLDANYTINLGEKSDNLMVGASYEKGSAYCQNYPVQHFASCREANPAWAAYGKLDYSRFTIMGEFIKTLKEWPGTFNPTAPLNQFAASKVTSFTIGGKYKTGVASKKLDLSLEFSRFMAGSKGSPWEKQDQWVLGIAYFFTPTVKFFSEGIITNGYAPLNFISGGSIRDSVGNINNSLTHSDADANSKGVIIGVNAVF